MTEISVSIRKSLKVENVTYLNKIFQCNEISSINFDFNCLCLTNKNWCISGRENSYISYLTPLQIGGNVYRLMNKMHLVNM